MTTSIEQKAVIPSATPTEAELVAWAGLSREAQTSLYRAALTHPDCMTLTSDSMKDVLDVARARVAARGHG